MDDVVGRPHGVDPSLAPPEHLAPVTTPPRQRLPRCLQSFCSFKSEETSLCLSGARTLCLWIEADTIASYWRTDYLGQSEVDLRSASHEIETQTQNRNHRYLRFLSIPEYSILIRMDPNRS